MTLKPDKRTGNFEYFSTYVFTYFLLQIWENKFLNAEEVVWFFKVLLSISQLSQACSDRKKKSKQI